MTQDGTIDSDDIGCDTAPGVMFPESFRIDVPATLGLFNAVEGLGWGVAQPHANLAASTDMAIALFERAGGTEAEQTAAEALRDVWNRILARNLARAEGTTQLMLSAGRESLGYFQEAQCVMGIETLRQLDDPNFNVKDGQYP